MLARRCTHCASCAKPRWPPKPRSPPGPTPPLLPPPSPHPTTPLRLSSSHKQPPPNVRVMAAMPDAPTGPLDPPNWTTLKMYASMSLEKHMEVRWHAVRVKMHAGMSLEKHMGDRWHQGWVMHEAHVLRLAKKKSQMHMLKMTVCQMPRNALRAVPHSPDSGLSF
eukprot:1148470-Pelagomonas_calceolata.AAC.2